MRYVIAMVTATVMALAASLLVASPVASWMVRQFTFESPDTVASLHAATFMAVSLAALIFGFVLGWVGGRKWQIED